MFEWITRSRQHSPVTQGRWARPGLEQLEARDCPGGGGGGGPIITGFTVAHTTGRYVEISGMVKDNDLTGCTVTLSGVVSGQLAVNSDGSFDTTAQASGLGEVDAVADDALDQESDVAVAQVASDPPQITNFAYTHGLNNLYTFTGHVVSGVAPGMVVTFTGPQGLNGQTAVVDANGNFSITVAVLNAPSSWWASATTIDPWGQTSDEVDLLIN